VKRGERLAGRWTRAARAGTVIDLQADLMRFTVDAIAGPAFGTDVNTLESDDDIIQRHLDKIFPRLSTRIIVVPYWRFFKLPSDRKLDRALQTVNAAIDGFIANAPQQLAADPARRRAPQNLCCRPCSSPPTSMAAASTMPRWRAMCSPCCWPARTPRPTRWLGASGCCAATRWRWRLPLPKRAA
jgi:hypothetical protein